MKDERWIGDWWGEAPVRHRNYSRETCVCYDRLLLGLRERRAVVYGVYRHRILQCGWRYFGTAEPLKRSIL
jgi:hypothetical protein